MLKAWRINDEETWAGATADEAIAAACDDHGSTREDLVGDYDVREIPPETLVGSWDEPEDYLFPLADLLRPLTRPQLLLTCEP